MELGSKNEVAKVKRTLKEMGDNASKGDKKEIKYKVYSSEKEAKRAFFDDVYGIRVGSEVGIPLDKYGKEQILATFGKIEVGASAPVGKTRKFTIIKAPKSGRITFKIEKK